MKNIVNYLFQTQGLKPFQAFGCPTGCNSFDIEDRLTGTHTDTTITQIIKENETTYEFKIAYTDDQPTIFKTEEEVINHIENFYKNLQI